MYWLSSKSYVEHMKIKENVALVLHDLNRENVFPAGALIYAKNIKNELEPYLLEVLEKGIEDVKNYESVTSAPFFALFLLNEFRSPKLYPILLKIFYLDEEQLGELIGDALTECLGRITAANFTGSVAKLWAIFDDLDLYEFARTAALNALLILFLHDNNAKKIMDDLEIRLKSFIKNGDEDDIEDVTHLVDMIIEGRMSALYYLGQEAFAKNMIDLRYFDRIWFDRKIQEPLDKNRLHHNFIGSAYDEIRRWSSFQQEPCIALGGSKKIGRNDLCFCGSDQKYKKCCIEIKGLRDVQ